ncbi:EpsG family protein [Chryseobacterium gallinarum]|uniref:EpsG family protein n=1 Tax=Chryseobacterium gallinarum TaxID=1324352 RepID=UPI002025580B|nr:EpsG family protein [Chryseobacterium gallinarum]MCL8535272.1 EpsG family protein [Chryseobacterium gallinarum]
MRQINIISILLALISPFLALPTLLYGVIKKNGLSITLFVIFLGFLSYLFIPNYTDDKTRYIEIYWNFKNWDLISFIGLFYNVVSRDFILQTFLKIASELDIKPQVVFFIVTVTVIGIVFKIWKEITIKLGFNNTESTISMLLIFTSVSLLDLFSGTRFMFASGVALYGYFQGFIMNKKWQPYIWLLIAINIHFSLIVFVGGYIIVKLLINKTMLIKAIFLTSFIFLFLPKDILVEILNILGLGGALASKGDAYISSNKDFSENYFKESGTAGVIIYFFQVLWIFMMYIYMVVHIKSNKIHHLLLFLLIAILNIFYSTTTVYLRYSLFIKLILGMVLLIDMKNYNSKKVTIYFIASFVFILITQIIIARYNIEASYTKNSFFLLDILFQKPVTTNDVIY